MLAITVFSLQSIWARARDSKSYSFGFSLIWWVSFLAPKVNDGAKSGWPLETHVFGLDSCTWNSPFRKGLWGRRGRENTRAITHVSYRDPIKTWRSSVVGKAQTQPWKCHKLWTLNGATRNWILFRLLCACILLLSAFEVCIGKWVGQKFDNHGLRRAAFWPGHIPGDRISAPGSHSLLMRLFQA